MSEKFEKMLVEQCAPTLMGVKPANLYRYFMEDRDACMREVMYWNSRLMSYGISVRILKECPETNAILLYVYRREWVEQILTEPETAGFLKRNGYRLSEDCEMLLRQLSGRLCLEREFPHEIGIFLGYPLEDVIGFIENEGRNYTCCGFWKSYGDPGEARYRFDGYRNCIQKCRDRFEKGVSLIQLLAAV